MRNGIDIKKVQHKGAVCFWYGIGGWMISDFVQSLQTSTFDWSDFLGGLFGLVCLCLGMTYHVYSAERLKEYLEYEKVKKIMTVVDGGKKT
jgi:hypothetical protein